jgi:hypothetical protein
MNENKRVRVKYDSVYMPELHEYNETIQATVGKPPQTDNPLYNRLMHQHLLWLAAAYEYSGTLAKDENGTLYRDVFANYAWFLYNKAQAIR